MQILPFTDENGTTMRAALCTFIAAVASASAAAGPADDYARGYKLAIDKGCFDCHALGASDAGPSFRAIANRYRFNAKQAQLLPVVIRGGSAGHWGNRFVMWPQPQLSNEEARRLVEWILSQ